MDTDVEPGALSRDFLGTCKYLGMVLIAITVGTACVSLIPVGFSLYFNQEVPTVSIVK